MNGVSDLIKKQTRSIFLPFSLSSLSAVHIRHEDTKRRWFSVDLCQCIDHVLPAYRIVRNECLSFKPPSQSIVFFSLTDWDYPVKLLFFKLSQRVRWIISHISLIGHVVLRYLFKYYLGYICVGDCGRA